MDSVEDTPAGATPRERWCPSCRTTITGTRLTCPQCMATLAASDPGHLVCRHCGTESPGHIHTCRTCLAELTPDPEAALAAAGDLLAAGHRLWRPADWEPFHRGPDCSVIRLGPDSALMVVGPEGLLEASVRSPRARAAPPLECRDVDGTTLFVLVAYQAQDSSLTALDGDGRPIATFLTEGLSPARMDVRDETSAPVARMVRSEQPGSWDLMETGGPRLATLVSQDHVWDDIDDQWQVDDQWTLSTHRALPLMPLAGVALAVAAKALFGRLEPARRRPEKPEEAWASGWHWKFE